MADLDAELEDMMNVATDGDYNLKILNDAFEGRAHENEELELVRVGEEMKIKKRTKRPPRPENTKKNQSNNTAASYCGMAATNGGERDPRLEAIMEEVMQRTADDFYAIDSEYREEDKDGKSQDDDDDNDSDAYKMALVPVTSDTQFDVKRRKRNRELLKMQAKAISASNPEEAAKALYDAEDGSTFVTGGGIPGRVKK